MNIENVQALIAQKKIVTLADIIPAEAYVQIGVFQHGNRRKGAADANTYAPYVIPVSELGGGGTPITLNVIPKGSGASIVDGNWQFIVDDIMPLISGSNVGNNIYRIGTMFMNGSVLDYAGSMTWVVGANTRMTLTTAGDLGLGVAVPTARLHASGSTNDNTAYVFKADSLAGTIWFNVRNDGAVNIGAINGSAFDATLSVVQRSAAFTTIMDIYNAGFSKLCFRATDNGAAGQVILGNSVIEINNYSNNIGIGLTPGAAKIAIRGSAAAMDVLAVTPSAGTGGVYIADAANAPFIYMQNATAATKVVLHTNGDSALNGGRVAMTALPTSNVGLPTGNLYVDTAANILANGDLVVGWKV